MSNELNLNQYITFSVGTEKFGISVLKAKEVRFFSKDLTKVPKMPPFMIGVINVRNAVLPVINLKDKLGIEPILDKTEHQKKEERIIVIEVDGDDGTKAEIGVLVDSVSEVMEIQKEIIDFNYGKISSGIDSEFVHGIAKFGDNEKFIILLDTNKVLSTKELGELSVHNRKLEESKENH